MTHEPVSRKRNAAQTRAAILDAARRLFSERGYDQTGLREIASEAHVNVALVIRYFTSKEMLFQKAIMSAFTIRPLIANEQGGEIQQPFSEILAQNMLLDSTAVEFYPLFALLRSAAQPQGAKLLREGLTVEFIQPLAERLDGERASLRATLVAALLLGVAMAQDVLAIPSLVQAQNSEVEALLEKMLRSILDANGKKDD